MLIMENRKMPPKKNNKTYPGYFMTIEGIEGAGKSTAVQLVKQWLIEANVDHIITREPGGTEIAEAIRQILLATYSEKMDDQTELLLMFAGRAQHLAHIIKPALIAGQWVVCDRFTDASYAYQGGGRGIPVERIAALEQWVQAGLHPDCTLLFDVPVEVGLARIQQRASHDRIEQEQMGFFNRVRQAYLQRAKHDPQRYQIIDANQTLEEVEQQIKAILTRVV